jgi:hypothetical protein
MSSIVRTGSALRAYICPLIKPIFGRDEASWRHGYRLVRALSLPHRMELDSLSVGRSGRCVRKYYGTRAAAAALKHPMTEAGNWSRSAEANAEAASGLRETME